MADLSFSRVYSSLDSVEFLPSRKTSQLLKDLSANKMFVEKIFDCRNLLKLKNIYSTDAINRKEDFDKYLKTMDLDLQKEYIRKIYEIRRMFNLPFNFMSTLNYIVGTGLIINPSSSIVVFNSNEDNRWKFAYGLNILVLESMTISALKKQIDLNRETINRELKKIPKVRTPVQHKDGLRLGWLIAFCRDTCNMSNPEIASFIQEISYEDPGQLNSKEVVELGDEDVSIYYKRFKENPYTKK